MPKNKTKEETLVNPKGKTVEELKEIVQVLQTQLQDHQKQATYHQTMTVKAQGALEVILQMIPKEEADEMVAQELKDNHQEVENSDS